MALKIRLQRHGAKHGPSYRIVVAEAAARREGKFVEILGHYNPCARGQALPFELNTERANYWLSVGAKPTNTVRTLIKRSNKKSTAPSQETAPVQKQTPEVVS